MSEKGSFQSHLGDNYKRPSGLKRLALYRIGDWPVYSLLLALGQIIAATSYQINLLSGAIKQDEVRFYTIAGIYMITSILWWLLFRSVKSVYVLSVPFFYGLAFLMLGLTTLIHAVHGRAWGLNVGTGMYAIASSSGSLYFALNFGDEGGSPIKAWVYRCCVIQGTQQIYVCALWFWGDYLTWLLTRGMAINIQTKTLTVVMVPIACLLFAVGTFLYFALPGYCRQDPGKVPSFYSSIWRRNVIVWFFITVILQNAFLSTQYGRNRQYLWSSNHTQAWHIALLTIFFLFLWAFLLAVFGKLSQSHPWILPIFAIGLGNPRWAQTLWSCSNIGTYLPWLGSPLASAMVGRSLWLWLGVLDALQGVGFGLILLQTLTRIHISFALISAQVLGTITTMVAHAIGTPPGPIFPDFSVGAFPGIAQPWFWVGLGAHWLFVVVSLRFLGRSS
jgi:alpha-1,3-glucan synthase